MSKYPRTYHFDFSPGATSDDKISDNIDNLVGSEIIISEKLDGSNTAIVKDGVYSRSHSDFTGNAWDIKSWELWEKIKGDIDDNVFLFGEGMYGIHSIEYTNLKSYFYMFGIRDNNIWVPWDKVEEYSYLLDIPTVPVLFRGVIKTKKELIDMVNKLVKEPSSIGGIREGVVARSAGMFHNDYFKDNVVKYVRANHVQTDKHWTRSWRKANIKY